MMFYIGDVVYLKSESKEMTISFFSSSQNNGFLDVAHCVWLDKEHRLWEASFYLQTLEKRTK